MMLRYTSRRQGVHFLKKRPDKPNRLYITRTKVSLFTKDFSLFEFDRSHFTERKKLTIIVVIFIVMDVWVRKKPEINIEEKNSTILISKETNQTHRSFHTNCYRLK